MERIFLRVFLGCMVAVASFALTIIWGFDPASELPFKVAGTCFIVGLACFLAWFVTIAYQFLSLK